MPLLSTSNKISVRIATIISAIALGLACSQLAIQFIPGDEFTHTPTPAVDAVSAPDKRPTPQYAELPKWNLFGKPKTVAEVKIKKVEPIVAPETRLNLELEGIVYSDMPAEGIAIISESGKPQKTYHIGETLPGNATLYAIEPSRVILQRNGRHETLSLRKPSDIQTPLSEQTARSLSRAKPFQAQPNQKIM